MKMRCLTHRDEWNWCSIWRWNRRVIWRWNRRAIWMASTECSWLSFTQQLQPVKTSRLLFHLKNPESGSHLFPASWSVSMEWKIGWFWPEILVIWAHCAPAFSSGLCAIEISCIIIIIIIIIINGAHWLVMRILVAIRWNRLQWFECWNQTQIIVPSTSQHSTTWWSEWKLVRKEVGHRGQPQALCCQTLILVQSTRQHSITWWSDHRAFHQSTQYRLVVRLKACEERGGAWSSAPNPLLSDSDLYAIHQPTQYRLVVRLKGGRAQSSAPNLLLSEQRENDTLTAVVRKQAAQVRGWKDHMTFKKKSR